MTWYEKVVVIACIFLLATPLAIGCITCLMALFSTNEGREREQHR